MNYMYLLTLTGIKEKTDLTLRYLQYKSDEFIKLKKEIEILKQEAQKYKEQS